MSGALNRPADDGAESVLQNGETLSGFIETSVRETIERRRMRAEFIARGMASRQDAKRSGGYVALFEIEGASTVTILALRHQLEDDYH